MMDKEPCRHGRFRAWVDVNPVSNTGHFMAEIHLYCDECDEPFKFLGLDYGMSLRNPMVSRDRLELRAPVAPESELRVAV